MFVPEIIMDFKVISYYILNGRTSSNPVQYDPWVLSAPGSLSLFIPDVRTNVGPSMRESVSLALGIPSQAEQMKNE